MAFASIARRMRTEPFIRMSSGLLYPLAMGPLYGPLSRSRLPALAFPLPYVGSDRFYARLTSARYRDVPRPPPGENLEGGTPSCSLRCSMPG